MEDMPSDMISFWFSDYFNLDSDWWYQYDEKGEPFCWYFTDAGCALLDKHIEKRYIEFTKYRLSDFMLNTIISLDEGNDTSVFEFYFRKDGERQLSIQFFSKDRLVKLIERDGDETRILKKSKLPYKFFNTTIGLQVTVNENEISCSISGVEILRYKGKGILSSAGRMGFSATNLRLALHQMNAYSVRDNN